MVLVLKKVEHCRHDGNTVLIGARGSSRVQSHYCTANTEMLPDSPVVRCGRIMISTS